MTKTTILIPKSYSKVKPFRVTIPLSIQIAESFSPGSVIDIDVKNITPGLMDTSKRPVGRPPLGKISKTDDTPCPECGHGMFLHRTGKCGFAGCTCVLPIGRV